MRTPNLSTVAARLAFARGLSGLSQRALSLRAGLTRPHVGMIESGARRELRYETMRALATTLGVSIPWLMIGEGVTPSERTIRTAVGRAA